MDQTSASGVAVPARSGDSLPRTCIIGAGSSGITAVKALSDRGLPFDCFEKSDRVGGNWVLGNRNGMSSSYSTLHINTSRERMEYADLPMPSSYPDFPRHDQIARYFDEYVDRFGLREKISFERGVRMATRTADGRWQVRLEDGEQRLYDALIVANGHHWDPRWPEPAIPGEFSGEVMHSHQYTDPSQLTGRRVVVVGIAADARTGRVPVLVRLANPDQRLRRHPDRLPAVSVRHPHRQRHDSRQGQLRSVRQAGRGSRGDRRLVRGGPAGRRRDRCHRRVRPALGRMRDGRRDPARRRPRGPGLFRREQP